jgi:hypothetical protein
MVGTVAIAAMSILVFTHVCPYTPAFACAKNLAMVDSIVA